MRKKKCLIIYNPNSGKGNNKNNIQIYFEILKDKGFDVDVIATKYNHHATKAVMEAKNYDIVFSIGGDGTLNEVVQGNFFRKRKLTICPLPSGTCNDVATMLGYGQDPKKNIELALDGDVKSMDIGTINDTPFVYVVGMGKFMNVPYETKSADKKKNGYLAYLKEAFNEIVDRLQRYRAEVIVDGEKLDGQYSLIMISNSDHIAGIDLFYKAVCLDDGLMQVPLCKARTKKEFVKSFLKLFLGRKANNLISLKAHDIKIKLIDKPAKKWCIDGEKYDYDGDTYCIKSHGRMKVLAPKRASNKLFKAN